MFYVAVQYALYHAPEDFPDWPYVLRPWAIAGQRISYGPVACLARDRHDFERAPMIERLCWVPRMPDDPRPLLGVYL
jgi:hypothetical protein